MIKNRNNKSITVKQFDEEKANKELKTCPKIIRDYVKLLKEQVVNWKDIQHKTIQKLHETTQNLKQATDEEYE